VELAEWVTRRKPIDEGHAFIDTTQRLTENNQQLSTPSPDLSPGEYGFNVHILHEKIKNTHVIGVNSTSLLGTKKLI
jgi:hypothetical protein